MPTDDKLLSFHRAQQLKRFADIVMGPRGAIYCHPDDLETAKRMAPPDMPPEKLKTHPHIQRGAVYAVDEAKLDPEPTFWADELKDMQKQGKGTNTHCPHGKWWDQECEACRDR